MSPLERLFRLEIEFHRRLRSDAPGTGDASSLHTSYALQSGYDALLAEIGKVNTHDVEILREQLTLVGDTRDLLAARDSLKCLLGVPLHDP